MSLILRGYHFQDGSVIGFFAHLDPTQADVRRVDIHVQPGDVIYIIDDSLSMGDFDVLGQLTNEGRYTEADVRAVSVATEEYTAPDLPRRPNDMIMWTKIGRAAGTFHIYHDETKTEPPQQGIAQKVALARTARGAVVRPSPPGG